MLKQREIYVQKYNFPVTVGRLLHNKSHTIGTPGVNLSPKSAGDIWRESHERRARNLSDLDALFKTTGKGGLLWPPLLVS